MPTTTNIVTKRCYPALSEVITIDDLPEFLHFSEDGSYVSAVLKTDKIERVGEILREMDALHINETV